MPARETINAETNTNGPEQTVSQKNWELIRTNRLPLADTIEELSRDFPRPIFQMLSGISIWLRGPVQYEQALSQPNLLAICLPLIRSAASGDQSAQGAAIQVSEEQLQQSVRQGIHEIVGRNPQNGWRFFGLMLYPIIAGMLAWAVWITACFLFFPGIGELFEDVGANLPMATRYLLRAAELVRQWWPLMILLPASFVGLFFGMSYLGMQSRDGGLSWLDRKLLSRRSVLGAWAWHLSLLLEWGVNSKTAVMVAGVSSRKGWLQQRSLEWIGDSTDRRTSRIRPNIPENLSRSFLTSLRYQWLNYVMTLPLSEAKIQMLREVSLYYREQGQIVIEIMLGWVSTLVTWLVMGFVVLVLAAIYSPILQIIRAMRWGF